MKNYLILFGLCVSVQASCFVDTVKYTILTAQKISGKQSTWSDAPGKVSYKYEYNDRGRGPKIKVDLTLEKGMVVLRNVKGVDYYKGSVNETFEISNGLARWKNNIEDGTKSVSGPVLYSPIDGAPGEIEWTLKLLLTQPGHQLDMLPSGKLKAEHVKSHSSLVNGFKEEMELYAFSGSGGPPDYVWVTPKKEYFASVSDWGATIKLGYEFLVPELRTIQSKVEEEFYLGQVFGLTQKQTTPIAIIHANVFDSKTGKMLPDHTVVIDQGKITQVGKSKEVNVPSGYKTIDGTGKTLMPGLWDNHTHFDKSQGLYHLAAGVTNIKDMANSPEIPAIKKKVDNNDLLGPDISVLSGFIDFAGPFAGPGKTVTTLEEGIKAVDFYADNGYQQIKLYSSIPVEWVKPLADEAHKRGLKVCGHIPSHMTAERAVNDGYDQIIHLNMIMLNFLGDSLDTRSMGRFTKVGERAKDINLKSEEVKRFVKLLKDKHIVVDPTIAIFEGMFVNEPGKLAAGYETAQSMFPAELKRSLYTQGLPAKKGHEADYAKSFAVMMEMLKLLHDNKIQLVPGTDGFPGFTLDRELELYVKAGISNADVLKMATIQSAEVAGKQSEFGSVEVGKKANLILIDGDPLRNISDIRKVELTIKGGNLYDPKALYANYGFGFWK